MSKQEISSKIPERKDHFVPQAYLSNFCNKETKKYIFLIKIQINGSKQRQKIYALNTAGIDWIVTGIILIYQII